MSPVHHDLPEWMKIGVEDGDAPGRMQDAACSLSDGLFRCTRPRGHDGDHAAWGISSVLIARWNVWASKVPDHYLQESRING